MFDFVVGALEGFCGVALALLIILPMWLLAKHVSFGVYLLVLIIAIMVGCGIRRYYKGRH